MATIATGCIVHDRKYLSQFHRAINQLRRAKEFDVNILQRLPKRCCSCYGQDGLSSVNLDSLRAVCHQMELPTTLKVHSRKPLRFRFRGTQRDTIFIQNLPCNVTREDLQTVVSLIGVIQIDKKTRLPKILIYKNKITGEGKGEATITYEDEDAAQAVINWYDGKEFLSNIITISLAKRRIRTFGGWGGFQRRGGARGAHYSSSRGNRLNLF